MKRRLFAERLSVDGFTKIPAAGDQLHVSGKLIFLNQITACVSTGHGSAASELGGALANQNLDVGFIHRCRYELVQNSSRNTEPEPKHHVMPAASEKSEYVDLDKRSRLICGLLIHGLRHLT